MTKADVLRWLSRAGWVALLLFSLWAILLGMSFAASGAQLLRSGDTSHATGEAILALLMLGLFWASGPRAWRGLTSSPYRTARSPESPD